MTAGPVSSTASLKTFAAAVEGFDRRLRAIDDRALDLFWAWETYDEEGVRFGILRTTEQVADAAVEVAARRVEAGAGPSRGQRILGRYQVAWRELWSVADRADSALDTPPMEGEWALRMILDHVIDGELGFLVTIRNGLDQHRAGIREPVRVASDEAWMALAEVDEPSWRAALDGSLDDIREFHRTVRDRITDRFGPIGDEELDANSAFWDGVRPNRFRLGRIESHLRQHTIQAEKAVQATMGPPREVERLLRLLTRATGDVEAAAVGADRDLLADILDPLSGEIVERGEQLEAAIASS
jgi:hypothetical protein